MSLLTAPRAFRTLPLAALLALGLAAPGAAQAATRYASPAGAGIACTAASPCSLPAAAGSAVRGDEIVAAAGTYDLTAAVPLNGVWLHGADGARPLLRNVSPTSTSFVVVYGGGHLSDVAVESKSSGTAPVLLAGGTVERTLAVGTPVVGAAVMITTQRGTESLVRNSILRAGVGVYVTGSEPLPAPVKVAGVTAVADVYGLRVDAAAGSVAVVGSILEGGLRDVLQLSPAASTNVANSTFGTSSGAFASLANLAVAPAFVDRSGGDLHQAPGSRTIDAGAASPDLGDTDYDGNARALGAAPDIGAYESVPVPVPAPAVTDPTDPSTGTPSTPGSPDVPSTPGSPNSPAERGEDPVAAAFLKIPARIQMSRDGRFPLTIGCPATSPGTCKGRYSITVAAARPKAACSKAKRSKVKGKRCPAARSRAKASAAAEPKVKAAPKPVVVASGIFTVEPGKTKTVKVLARNGRIREIRKHKGKCMARISTTSLAQPLTLNQPLTLVPAPGSSDR